MKLIVVATLALVACAYAAPVEKEVAQILEENFDKQPDGAYVYGFKSSDGTQREENGELKEALDEENKPHQVIVVRGSYFWNDADGNPQSIKYYADETGFHAEGDTIPKEQAASR